MTDGPVTDDWSAPGVFEVAPGVHRIPLPLPGDGLKAVNVYAIEQPDGLVMIDSGWAIGNAQRQLEAALGQLDRELGDIQRFLVTHVHRDHYELAVTLRKLFGAKVALGRGEQPSLQLLLDPAPRREMPLTRRLLAAGARELVEALDRARGGKELELDWGMPDEWLQDTQILELDGRRLEVVATPGHTRGHVVFLDREADILFSGDHVLPHITPSIGYEQPPAASPLRDYLASLALVRSLPDARLLPAHGPVAPTTHDRIDELFAHHDERLELSEKAVLEGADTAWEVAHVLPWTRRGRAFDDLDMFNQMLAVNETVAHLDVLVERERLEVVTDDEGVRHYLA